MKLSFIELPPFERYRTSHLTDDEYRRFQNELLSDPEKGDIVQGTGGLRKVRLADGLRNKGKRGGARVIYYYYVSGSQIWLFYAYGKNIQENLSDKHRKELARMLVQLKLLAE